MGRRMTSSTSTRTSPSTARLAGSGLLPAQVGTSTRACRDRTRLGCGACPHSCSGRALAAISDPSCRALAQPHPVPVRSASGEEEIGGGRSGVHLHLYVLPCSDAVSLCVS